jgi:hypothetical protein
MEALGLQAAAAGDLLVRAEALRVHLNCCCAIILQGKRMSNTAAREMLKSLDRVHGGAQLCCTVAYPQFVGTHIVLAAHVPVLLKSDYSFKGASTLGEWQAVVLSDLSL